MTSLLKSSTNGLSGSSCETVAEGARRATGETVSQEAARRGPEVVAIARRRKFSGSEKRRLLAEAGQCKERGSSARSCVANAFTPRCSRVGASRWELRTGRLWPRNGADRSPMRRRARSSN